MPPLSDLAARLSSAILSDVLDELGHRHQACKPFVRPLDEAGVLCGFARTGAYALVEGVEPGRNPYAVEMALIDDLKAGEVAVLACGGPTDWIAPWGELLSTAATVRGSAGCLTDGLVRDVRQIRAMGFPVFAGGIGPLDTKGRAEMTAMDVPVTVGGVAVAPGDLVFGDVDGCVVVPEALIEEAVGRALAKLAAEDRTRDALLAGESLASVYARYGVL
jgi:4-hydroxy-4-methyl-2-oxoglutarate aldolase